MTATPTLRPGHLPRVPTLTEVIDVPEGAVPPPTAGTEPTPPLAAAVDAPVPAVAPPPVAETTPWPTPAAASVTAPLPSAGPSTGQGPAAAGLPAAAAAGRASASPVGLQTTAHALTPLEEQQMTQKVLAEVQQRIDLMFEYRLREALAPALARLTDAVLRDARVELATTLRDVVARAVAQELSRHRQR